MLLQRSLPLRQCARPAPRGAALRAVATAPSELAASPSLERFPRKAELDARYSITELLGQGTYSTVYAGIDAVSGEEVAIKMLPKYQHLKNRVQDILTEIDIRRQLRGCRNAIQLFGVYEDKDAFWLVEELCAGGDVQGLLAAEGVLSEAEAAKVLEGVLHFLADSHARQVAVGDVKPANFAIKHLYPSIAHIMDPSRPRGRLEVRAIDFGCCQRFDEHCLLPRFTGTPVYMAPEVLMGCPGLGVDVWAAGVLLYELLCGRFPFWDCEPLALDSMTPPQLRDGIINAPVLFNSPAWRAVSPGARDLIERMLDRSIASRISAAEALQHPWLQAAAASHA